MLNLQRSFASKIGKYADKIGSDETKRIVSEIGGVLKQVMPKNEADKIVEDLVTISVKLDAVTKSQDLTDDQILVYFEFLRLLLCFLSIMKLSQEQSCFYSYPQYQSSLEKVYETLKSMMSGIFADKTLNKLKGIYSCLSSEKVLTDLCLRLDDVNKQKLTNLLEESTCILSRLIKDDGSD